MDAQEAEAQAFKPRGMQKANKQKFDLLPETFTVNELVNAELVKTVNSAYPLVLRWEKAGIIQKLERGKYKKVTPCQE
ncbi:MAG: hypothetical protein J5552_00020 [Prevotella sp.]|nr:hypothetical protein [Prevotella sp.]